MFHSEDIYPSTRQERYLDEREGQREVSFDASCGLALIKGPHGFMQIRLSRSQAEALATALAIPFKVTPPVCRCWNEGEWGRVHREDCPIHKDGQ